MNMFLHELKAYSKSTIIWSLSLAVVTILFLSMFSAFSGNAAELNKLLANLPEALKKAIGLSLENIFTVLGFYSYTLTYVVLAGAIQAMNLGTSIISKEVRGKTADFLLSKPVTRQQVLTSKLLAALTSLLMTNIVFFIVSAVMASAVSTASFSTKKFILLSLTLLFVQLVFFSLGFLASAVLHKIKSVAAVSMTTVFSFFIIGMLGSVVGEEAVRYITPFKYFDTVYIINNASYETNFVIVALAVIIVAIAFSYLVYSKKDIHVF